MFVLVKKIILQKFKIFKTNFEEQILSVLETHNNAISDAHGHIFKILFKHSNMQVGSYPNDIS